MSAESSIHILLVDDDEVDVMAVKRAFKKRSVSNSISVARHGLEALAMLRGEPGYQSIPHPYIILLDLNMPRMNGIEFLKILRQTPELRRSVVFVLTTSQQDEDKRAAYDQQAAGYIVKSTVGSELLNVVTMLDHYWAVVELP